MYDELTFDLEILKQFDGEHNYFNPSGRGDRILFRRERKSSDNVIVSEIVDEQDRVLLGAHDETILGAQHITTYDDPRWVDDNTFSAVQIDGVLNEQEIFHYRAHVKLFDVNGKCIDTAHREHAFEKNWQFVGDRIIYGLQPYRVMDRDYKLISEIYNPGEQWSAWEWGRPSPSTNPFKIDGTTYMLFHSRIIEPNGVVLNYYNSVLKLDDDLRILGFYNQPLFDGFTFDYGPYYNWKRTAVNVPTVANVVYCTTVELVDDTIKIYCGINDHIAGVITIEQEEFVEYLEGTGSFIAFE